MKIEIKIPSLGESISEITIGQIISAAGTWVKVDDEILEMETDKVNQLLYAPQAGKLSLTAKQGDVVKIGSVVGWIDTDVIEDVAKVEKKDKPQPVPAKLIEPEKQKSNLTENLRYLKEDFLDELKNSGQVLLKPVPHQPKEIKHSDARETRKPLSKIRQVIARRLVEAQQTTAMLTTFNEVDLSAVIQARERYKDSFIKKYGSKLGFMSFFVKACISALEAFPDVNSYLDGDEVVHRNYYDIGVAIGTDRGVIVPILRDADKLGFGQIEQKIEHYAKLARESKLTLDDLQGGGFTITNGGTYGSLLSTPILIPPQCAILGMHKIEKRPVVVNDQIVIRSMMYLALSYDHRLIDGKEAVSFLVHIKNGLEDPSRLLLDI